MGALRSTSVILLTLAVVLGAVAQTPWLAWESGQGVVPVEGGGNETVQRDEYVWSVRAQPQDTEGNASSASYFDASQEKLPNGESTPGLLMVRLGGPILDSGLLLLLVGLVLVLARKSLPGGVVALLGAVFVAAMVALFTLGLNDYNQDPGDGSRFGLGLGVGFYLGLTAAVLALAGVVLALSDRSGSPSREDGPVIPRPILSVQNPHAFDPMRNRDPRPFTPDPPTEYKEFQVTGPKTFKATGPPGGGFETVPEPGSETPPAKPAPGAKPAAQPGAKSAAKPGAQAPAGTKPGAPPPAKPATPGAGQAAPAAPAKPAPATPAATKPGAAVARPPAPAPKAPAATGSPAKPPPPPPGAPAKPAGAPAPKPAAKPPPKPLPKK